MFLVDLAPIPYFYPLPSRATVFYPGDGDGSSLGLETPYSLPLSVQSISPYISTAHFQHPLKRVDTCVEMSSHGIVGTAG